MKLVRLSYFSTENESVVDFTPFAFQPEFMPTNGTHQLLKFRYVL